MSLGQFLVDARSAARVEVVSVRSMPSHNPRMPIISEVALKLVQPLFGKWDKKISLMMAGGRIGSVAFELEDQPVPKKGKVLLAARITEEPQQLGFLFLLGSRPDSIREPQWTSASKMLKNYVAARKKRRRVEFKSGLLIRPVEEFVHSSNDPIWDGTYPTIVTLYIWDNTSDLGAENAYEAIQRAINTWNNAGANVSIRRVVRAGGLPVSPSDQQNIMRWSPIGPPNQWAVTGWSSNSSTNKFIDADIQFWENMAWSTAPAAGTGDIESIALHELGHYLGLPHSSGANDVMQPGIPAGVARRALSAADIVALQNLYGSRPVGAGVIYRWNNGKDHFYTPSAYGELAPDLGYVYEDAVFRLFPSGTANTARLFRWVSLNSGDHFYTADPNGELAASAGYIYEGSIGNIATSQITTTVPLFRWLHPGIGDHFYTTDPNGELAPTLGYVSEGVAGFVLTPPP
jgi:Matrixin/Repeat of unknown function (DUF5648)